MIPALCPASTGEENWEHSVVRQVGWGDTLVKLQEAALCPASAGEEKWDGRGAQSGAAAVGAAG